MELENEIQRIVENAKYCGLHSKEATRRILVLFGKLVLLTKPNYLAKDGTIKRGIEIDGKHYAPQNDC